MIGNTEGKLWVQRQIEDYALRGLEFEAMGFLTFTVETYERRKSTHDTKSEKNRDDEDENLLNIEDGRYLSDHPKANTHYRVCRNDNHNFLPNIVGPWLPRRDDEGGTKSYYYAAMLAFLKPWRDLRELIGDCESWEVAFNQFLENANQRDRDVVAGCQYYYDSRNVIGNDEMEEGRNTEENEHETVNEEFSVGMELDDESSPNPVSFF